MVTMIETMAKVIEREAPVGEGGQEIRGVYALSLARCILERMAEAAPAMAADPAAADQWRRMVNMALNDPQDLEVWDAAAARSEETFTPITEDMRSAITSAWGADVADQIGPKKPN